MTNQSSISSISSANNTRARRKRAISRRNKEADETRYFKRLKKSVETASEPPIITPTPVYSVQQSLRFTEQQEPSELQPRADELQAANSLLSSALNKLVAQYSRKNAPEQQKSSIVCDAQKLVHILLATAVARQEVIATNYQKGQRVNRVDPYQVSTRTLQHIIQTYLTPSDNKTPDKEVASADSDDEGEEEEIETTDDDDDDTRSSETESSSDSPQIPKELQSLVKNVVSDLTWKKKEQFSIPPIVVQKALSRMRSIRNHNRFKGDECFYNPRLAIINRPLRLSD